MFKLYFYTLLACIILIYSSCNHMGAEKDVEIAISDSVVNTMRGGFGASLHAMQDSIIVEKGISWGGSAWGANPEPEDTLRWKELYAHLDWLGMDWYRVEIEHRIFEPEKGKFTFESREMKILYRYLDYCEKNQADVFLQEMYPNVGWLTLPGWQDKGDYGKIRSAPSDLKAWANGLASLVQYLQKTKKYTCIKWLCIANEPMHSWGWWQNADTAPVSITPALKLVRESLDQRKLSVPLSGPDWSFDPKQTPDKVDFSDYVGAYDLHSYLSRFDWYTKSFKFPMYSLREADSILSNWKTFAKKQNKPLFISEFGSFVYGFSPTSKGPATFDAALKDIELVIRHSNIGVDAFNKWSLLNRGDLDGTWQMINTWDTKKKRLYAKMSPSVYPYYFYGLFTRLTSKYAQVCKTEVTEGSIQWDSKDSRRNIQK